MPKPRKLHGPVGDEANNRIDRGDSMLLRHGEYTGFAGPSDPPFEGRSCGWCGFHICKPGCDEADEAELDRTVALEALREARYGSTWDSREIDDEPSYVSPEDARRLMGSLSGLNSVVRGCGYCGRSDGAHETDCRALHEALSGHRVVEYPLWKASVASHLRPCIVCSVPHNGAGAACLTCVQRADAEAKPFRDAMDEKIKTLAQHAHEKLGHLDLIKFPTPVGEIKVVASPYVWSPTLFSRPPVR